VEEFVVHQAKPETFEHFSIQRDGAVRGRRVRGDVVRGAAEAFRFLADAVLPVNDRRLFRSSAKCSSKSSAMACSCWTGIFPSDLPISIQMRARFVQRRRFQARAIGALGVIEAAAALYR